MCFLIFFLLVAATWLRLSPMDADSGGGSGLAIPPAEAQIHSKKIPGPVGDRPGVGGAEGLGPVNLLGQSRR